MKIIFVLLQAAESSDTWMSLLPLFLILVVFYFFFIRPQTKKNKDLKKFREAIKKGDKVITIGGVHGKRAAGQEKTLVLDIGNQLKLTVEKSAVAMDGEQVGQTKQ